jgi:integrase
MTWGQIEQRGEPELWKYLFLDEAQIADLLKHVKDKARHGFIYPMFVFVAYTGARRSEVIRSERKDWDFESGQIRIRERKRRKDKAMTFRMVPMHSRLRDVMQSWFAEHPSDYAIANGSKLTRDSASHHFTKTLEESRWEVVKGFHVLRHSFGSNLARSGKVGRDTIASWMGHTTEEMMTLYQHLFPQDWNEQINVLA